MNVRKVCKVRHCNQFAAGFICFAYKKRNFIVKYAVLLCAVQKAAPKAACTRPENIGLILWTGYWKADKCKSFGNTAKCF